MNDFHYFLKVWWHYATLFVIYYFWQSFTQYNHTFIHPSSFAVFLYPHRFFAQQENNLHGLPSRESNSGLPYSKPTHYQRSHAAPWPTEPRRTLTNGATPHPTEPRRTLSVTWSALQAITVVCYEFQTSPVPLTHYKLFPVPAAHCSLLPENIGLLKSHKYFLRFLKITVSY